MERSPALDAVRVRLDVSYDGSAFSGWAVQPGRRTVQAVLQDAMTTVLRTPVALTVAGRTDAGVHATGQVAHCDVPEQVWAAGHERLIARLAGVLPRDVRVARAARVPGAFDARFAALWRRYEYRVCDQPGGVEPLRRGFVLGWPRELDDSAMRDAGARLLGLHDFAAFCRRREGGSTIRTVLRCAVARDGAEIVFTVQADAFCHSMVRSLIGALLAVGEHRRPPDWPAALLGSPRRADEVAVAAAHGLTLVAVGYPPDAELDARAARNRAVRTG
ncbi:MAG: tRNA pseudouridine(38-40) synthase TruA [Jatrophihabitantaceae bacterium]